MSGYTIRNSIGHWCGDYATKDGALRAVARLKARWPAMGYSVRPAAKSKGKIYG